MPLRVLTFLFVFLATVGGVVYALSLPSLSLRPVLYGNEVVQVANNNKGEDVQGSASTAPLQDIRPTLEHIATPEPVKAIYMSQCYASVPNLREKLLKIADTTEVNAILVDIKDYTGTIAWVALAARCATCANLS
jgi:hypothetical protein